MPASCPQTDRWHECWRPRDKFAAFTGEWRFMNQVLTLKPAERKSQARLQRILDTSPERLRG
jgi:hypothetical protein